MIRVGFRTAGRMREAAVPVLIAGLLAVGVGGCSGDDDASPDAGPDAEAAAAASGAVAAAEFVSAAIEGADANGYLATTLSTGSGEELTIDQATLSSRIELLAAAFAGQAASVQASTTAYPEAEGDRAPACDESLGVYCQVDLLGASEQVLASVVVYWFGDGVTDFTVVTRASDGQPTGVGEAQCSDDGAVVHGGHSRRFDVAICVGPSGEAEYTAQERGTDRGIQLEACQEAPDERWVASNVSNLGEVRYVVDGSVSGLRSRLQAYDNGEPLLDDADQLFVPVRFDPPAAANECG